MTFFKKKNCFGQKKINKIFFFKILQKLIITAYVNVILFKEFQKLNFFKIREEPKRLVRNFWDFWPKIPKTLIKRPFFSKKLQKYQT